MPADCPFSVIINANSDAPNSSSDSPTKYNLSPGCFRSLVAEFLTSGWSPNNENSNVGGIEILSGPLP